MQSKRLVSLKKKKKHMQSKRLVLFNCYLYGRRIHLN